MVECVGRVSFGAEASAHPTLSCRVTCDLPVRPSAPVGAATSNSGGSVLHPDPAAFPGPPRGRRRAGADGPRVSTRAAFAGTRPRGTRGDLTIVRWPKPSAVHLVVQRVEAVGGRSLRFGMQRLLELLNL